jgi:hypothetical protein
MSTPDDRCAEARRLQQIDAAMRAGDLDALRAAVADPSVIPNGDLHPSMGSCLVSAIVVSPLPFIRTLLERGADPNAPADDGFPALISALVSGRQGPGMTPRDDVAELVRLLLAFGADPNQRGINDYTALHMAVAEGNGLAVQILLDGGADAGLRTRIDDYESPTELARAMGRADLVEILERGGRPARQRLRSGLVLLTDIVGTGSPVRRQHVYRIRLRLSLNRGEVVRWPTPWGPVAVTRLDADGETLVTEVRLDRRSLISGLFYGIDGMRVGGTRRLEIAPHLGYGERGVPGVIPANAVLIAEVTVVGER